MTKKSKISIAIMIAFATTTIFTSCKKENDARKPPAVNFKTTAGYTAGDKAVGKNDTLLVGIIADKTEDELKTFNVSYQFDGAATSTSTLTYTLTSAEQDHFEQNYTIITRNQVGSEKWTFTITDRDGNITSLPLTLTVN